MLGINLDGRHGGRGVFLILRVRRSMGRLGSRKRHFGRPGGAATWQLCGFEVKLASLGGQQRMLASAWPNEPLLMIRVWSHRDVHAVHVVHGVHVTGCNPGGSGQYQMYAVDGPADEAGKIEVVVPGREGEGGP